MYDPLSSSILGPSDKPALTLQLQPQQVEALVSESQFMAIVGGMRGGKSVTGLYLAFLSMVRNPGYRVFYIIPSYKKADIIIEAFNLILGRWCVERRAADKRYKLINGSELRIFSAAPGSEESFLGYECDLFMLEEFREMQSGDPPGSKVFDNAYSRVVSTGGRVVIVSSPETGWGNV